MAVGGYTTPPSVSRGYTEIWDGSSWTEGNDLNLAASGKGGGGTTTSAVLVLDIAQYQEQVLLL